MGKTFLYLLLTLQIFVLAQGQFDVCDLEKSFSWMAHLPLSKHPSHLAMLIE